jgi:hypothetical protein
MSRCLLRTWAGFLWVVVCNRTACLHDPGSH